MHLNSEEAFLTDLENSILNISCTKTMNSWGLFNKESIKKAILDEYYFKINLFNEILVIRHLSPPHN